MKQEYLKKEKNLFTFYMEQEDSQTPYILDVNSGVCYGKKGKALKNQPKALKVAIKYILNNTQNFDIDVVNMAITLNTTLNMHLLAVADKLASLGYSLGEDETSAYLGYIDKNFKAFAKSYKNNPALTFAQFSREYPFQQWLLKNNLRVDNYMPLEFLRFAYQVWTFTNYTKKLDVNLLIYYLKHGLYDYEEYPYSVGTKVDKYMYWCEVLKVKPKKDCFMRTYAELKIIFEKYQEDNSNDILKEVQNCNLEFENEKYKVVVPTTKREFVEEATNQHNCVFKMYYPRVLENRTNVVFIRNKQNLDKSLVTCEVQDGTILQYLLKNNRKVQDTELLEFKELYQEYLQENYQK